MLNIDEIKNIINTNSQGLNCEFKRLFHGRGGLYDGFNFLTVDSIDTILNVAFYFECEKELEEKLLEFLKDYIQTSQHSTLLLQRRYIKGSAPQTLIGELPEEVFAIENGLKFKLNLKSNQNSGYFPDMKNGRSFIQSISKDKKVLNLFSYTCGFSLSAVKGEASYVVNMDMAKNALKTGRENHLLNNLNTKNVKFYPHNILKSFSKLKKEGPFDIIIIDPPTFQKGSFEATNDYVKIVKRVSDISNKNCTVLACLNSPNLDSSFIIDLFMEYAPDFSYQKHLENLGTFKAKTEEKSLKNLIFTKN